MAKLAGGILGSISGKVAGVVAFRWKDKQAVRSYVVPANPQTESQVSNRTQFAACAQFASLILGAILQVYMDWSLRSMSAYNWFIKQNKDLFTETPDYEGFILSHGTLFAAVPDVVSNVANVVTIPFADDLGSNGLASDKVYAAVLVEGTGHVSFAAAEVLRSAATIDVTIPAGSSGDITAWLITARRDTETDAVIKVSDSQGVEHTLV